MGVLGTERELLSRPIPVKWCGWESDTRTLQYGGWQLAVEHQDWNEEYQLLLKHEKMKLVGITERTYLPRFPAHYQRVSGYNDAEFYFRILHVANNFEMISIQNTPPSFFEIDATPERLVATPLNSLGIFKKMLSKGEEVLIDSADLSVIDHLEAIKALQSTKQKKIRDRILNGEYDEGAYPNVNTLANLIEYS